MERNNRTEIYELQQMLCGVARANQSIPPVLVTGRYDAQTRNAVLAFQNACGLTPTGEVNQETWDALVAAHSALDVSCGPRHPVFTYPCRDYCIRREEKSETVLFIQILLQGLSTAYDTFYDVRPSGVYDRETEEAVAHFQKINRLPETGEVDAATWDALADNYNVFANNGQYQS